MNCSFTTTLFGLDVEATGTFTPEEKQTFDYPGCESEFEIERISFGAAEFEIDELPEKELERIRKEAFEAATTQAEDAADEWASELAAERRA